MRFRQPNQQDLPDAFVAQQVTSMQENAPAPTQEAIMPKQGAAASPSDLASLSAQLEQAYTQGMQQRERLAKALESGVQPQLDLSPLMRYAEAYTGTPTGYKAPQDISTKLAQAAQVRHGITQDQIALLKAKIAAKSKDEGAKMTDSAKTQFADLKTQYNSIDDLYSDWESKILGNRITRAGSKISAAMPGTTEAQYDDKLKQKAQLIGKALEGGKLTDVDYQKYIKFLPTAGDTEEEARNKIESLKTEIKNAYNTKLTTFAETNTNIGSLKALDNGADKYQDKGFLEWKKSKGLI